MKTIFLIRIFAFFPLCGIIIPDLLFKASDAKYKIPGSHIIVGVVISLIIISSFILPILYGKLRSFKKLVALFFNP
jgi:hypothetical protein